ncbi:helix-turn-helix domain-containing protein [Sinomicrobium weinanense]|uniref:Helix-turn-helix transcriptional regulator n=1 Tax=Sinomicrobium weinanense TaxID=2842200 RepID=A0A926JT61_9FLAO|nr:helix-turn-helix transcriptional regulator [Sinomicrobium weinanense]MBC9796803.1 helix-turn-helix transcriptional regulator [Sinomicrobium weinanense]MBU3123693.1 helix-turn-helix domain-containing protein [Sinomicrobium weinanense]
MAELSKEDIILANKIAKRIKQLRIQSTGVKQIDFANKYNIDRQIVSRWESLIVVDPKTGKPKGRGVTIYTVEKFCKLLGITLKDFFNDPIFLK